MIHRFHSFHRFILANPLVALGTDVLAGVPGFYFGAAALAAQTDCDE